MKCKCGKECIVLFAGGLCKDCFKPETIHDEELPKKRKETKMQPLWVRKKRAAYREMRALKAGAERVECPVCGKRFVKMLKSKIYCSMRCCDKASNERYKEMKK